MRRSLVRWKGDPSLIVHKRLPVHVRRQQERQLQLREEEEDTEPSAPPSIVVQIAQAARGRRRQPQLWSNLLNQALETSGELSPQDMASVLWSMSEVRYQHRALMDDFVRSLSFRADVKAMVTAMLAVDRLGLPTDALRAPFLQHLAGQCEHLSFGNLRRILMALARCWQQPQAPVQEELLEELCDAIVEKAHNCDPRDLLAVPQHMGRLRYLHRGLFTTSTSAVATLVSSRLTVLPLDVLRALDGLLLLQALVEAERPRQQLGQLAEKCKLMARQLLRGEDLGPLWRTGARLYGAEVVEPRIWSLWAAEVVGRRDLGVGKAQGIQHLRRRAQRQWRVPQAPEGLEVALQGLLREDSMAAPPAFSAAGVSA